MSATIPFDIPSLRWRPGMVAGLTVSLLFHAVLLFGYRLSHPPELALAARSMTVWLHPARPPTPTPATPKPHPRTPKPEQAPLPVLQPAVVAATQHTIPPLPELPTDTPVTSLPREQDPLYTDQQPTTFNLDAAKKAARKVTKEKDPAKAGTLTAQLEEHPLYPEQSTNELAQKIDAARRPSCLKGSGGLFAPLIWLMDKKDSGCKF